MNISLVAIGSAGDVHPFLAIGAALRARGHAVEVLTNPVFEPLVRRQALNFVPIGTAQQYRETVSHPKLWHAIDGLGVMWRHLIRHTLIPSYDHLRQAPSKGKAVVVASPVAFGARLARDRSGVPLVTAYTAATMLRSCADPMSLARWRVPRWMPGWARRRAWGLLDRHKLQPMARPALQALFAHAGADLPAVSWFGEWMHSPDAGVTLFPSWFADRPGDWPAQVRQAGFVLFDGDGGDGGDGAALRRFLDAGAPPVVFMPGTAERDTRTFFSGAARACDNLGLRGVLLGEGAEAIASGQGHLHGAPYAPFGTLLPRARALVHHGGAGSLAQGLRAGLPQLVAPKGYDQFDNAWRLERLGAGRMLSRHDDMGVAMTGGLRLLLADEACLRQCHQLAARMASERALEGIVELLERVACR